MTATTPDLSFRLDDFGRTWLSEHGDGYRLAVHWLGTGPQRDEVHRVARIHRELHDGGVTGCDTLPLDADYFPTFLAFLKDTPHEREIEDGVEAMAEINAAQGTNYPAWPRRCFMVSFDEAFMLGFAAAAAMAVKL